MGIVFALLPSHISLPRYDGRAGPHTVLFEVCPVFTRVAACTLALSPIRDTLIEGFSHFVTLYGAFFVKVSSWLHFFCLFFQHR